MAVRVRTGAPTIVIAFSSTVAVDPGTAGWRSTQAETISEDNAANLVDDRGSCPFNILRTEAVGYILFSET